jgi:hypothetical protein
MRLQAYCLRIVAILALIGVYNAPIPIIILGIITVWWVFYITKGIW